ncbi:hypothetical protein KBD71_00815 [Candidatus Woesebacteria bacterium]|nr:hypothetical protein [Candidatus Woesebacteria bacterium]
MAEYFFTQDQISTLTQTLEFRSPKKVLQDDHLINARNSIASLLFLEKSPDDIEEVIDLLQALTITPDLSVYFRNQTGALDSIPLQTLIDAVSNVKSDTATIPELMRDLKSAFRL